MRQYSEPSWIMQEIKIAGREVNGFRMWFSGLDPGSWICLVGINQKETEVKYQEGEKIALENLCLTGEPGIVKGEPKVGNQNEPRTWRARKTFPPCSSERWTHKGSELNTWNHWDCLWKWSCCLVMTPTEPVLLFDSIFILMYALTCI